MTRKDYVLIAETIRTIDRATFSIYDDVAEKLRANMAGHFAAMLGT